MYTVCWEDGYQSHLLVVNASGALVARAHTYWGWLESVGLKDFFTQFPEADARFHIGYTDLQQLIANSDLT